MANVTTAYPKLATIASGNFNNYKIPCVSIKSQENKWQRVY